jgi:uncharacterized protein (DUF58 family)
LLLRWVAFDLLGLGLLGAVGAAALLVARPFPLQIDRAISPARVPKGSPAVAVLTFANRRRRAVGPTVAVQPFGPDRVRVVVPRLRGGESGLRTYRLPTRQRGIFDVGPVEVVRRDPFDFFRRVRAYGTVERIWVYPRILPLRPLPTGRIRRLEGPTSDASPQGTVTFHRLRDYVAGDDLRLVHWRSSARTGRLVVRQNVDTSQPYTVVLFDIRPERYSPESFEDAVDVAASVALTSAAGKAPVELRLSDGGVFGGPRLPEVSALLDALTAVQPTPHGDLRTALAALRRARGGTSLIVVTGLVTADDLPHVAALRRRFERLVVVAVDPQAAGGRAARTRQGDTPPPVLTASPGVQVVTGGTAEDVAAAWNLSLPRGNVVAPAARSASFPVAGR